MDGSISSAAPAAPPKPLRRAGSTISADEASSSADEVLTLGCCCRGYRGGEDKTMVGVIPLTADSADPDFLGG